MPETIPNPAGAALIGPGSGQPWQMVRVIFPFAPGEFDEGRFRAAIGAQAASGPWFFSEGPDGSYHSHVDIERYALGAGAQPADAMTAAVSIHTYPIPLDSADPRVATGTHRDFFSALRVSAPLEAFHPFATVDLLYSADTSEWRTRLLAKPPEVTDLGSELGRVALSGVTLRFENAPSGLREARLEISPDNVEHYVSLRFFFHVSYDSVFDVIDMAIGQAASLSTLFVRKIQ